MAKCHSKPASPHTVGGAHWQVAPCRAPPGEPLGKHDVPATKCPQDGPISCLAKASQHVTVFEQATSSCETRLSVRFAFCWTICRTKLCNFATASSATSSCDCNTRLSACVLFCRTSRRQMCCALEQGCKILIFLWSSGPCGNL